MFKYDYMVRKIILSSIPAISPLLSFSSIPPPFAISLSNLTQTEESPIWEVGSTQGFFLLKGPFS